MIQNLLLFLTPENASQATPLSPPAVAKPAKPLAKGLALLKLGAGVLGNTVGFGVLIAGCWFSIQLMQLLLSPHIS
jgi:hypothetical protein